MKISSKSHCEEIYVAENNMLWMLPVMKTGNSLVIKKGIWLINSTFHFLFIYFPGEIELHSKLLNSTYFLWR